MRCSRKWVLPYDSQLFETDSNGSIEKKFRVSSKTVLEASASRHWRSRTHEKL